MSPDKQKVREKIVLAAIECVEKEGIDAITSRSIAREAGVNVAAINYYFGSKANLINEVFKQTLKEAYINNIKEYFPQDRQTDLNTVISFFSHTLTGMLNYPNITKAHLFEPFVHNFYDNDSVKGFTKFLTEISANLSGLIPHKNEAELKMKIVQVVSAVLFAGFLPGLVEDFLEFDLKDIQNQEKFLEILFENRKIMEQVNEN